LEIEVTCAQCGHRRTIDAASPRLRDRKVASARASSAERDVTKYSRSAKKDVKSAMRRRKKGKKVPKRRTSGKKSSK
jgi:hypothetical protein